MVLSQQNIAIVGCGPGGMASALFLARQGHNITLYERFAAPKPIGSGLLIQPSGQQVLQDLGLLEKIKTLGHSVERLHGLSVQKNRRALDMRYGNTGDGAPALGIHRASLFQVLMDAVVAQNIPIVVNSELVSLVESRTSVSPVFTNGRSAPDFDFLIDASGAYSALAEGEVRKLAFGAFWTTVDMPAHHDVIPNALDQRYSFADKMAGIMPVGVNPATGKPGAALFWSERPENVEQICADGIEKFRENYCQLWPEAAPFVSQINAMEELTMAVYSHRTGRTNSSQRVFHVGDSWHCTSPQLGQGANMALMDASALARSVSDSNTLEDIAKRYRLSRSFHIKLYQMLSVIFTPLYQSTGRFLPLIRDMVIHNFAGGR